jgi:hypothetical protein
MLEEICNHLCDIINFCVLVNMVGSGSKQPLGVALQGSMPECTFDKFEALWTDPSG